jgi:large conductance mechanosensitive channel
MNVAKNVKMDMVHQFINFLKKFGVIGLAIGIIVGGAVKDLVDSMVTNILNPILGLIPNLKGLDDMNIAKDAAGKIVFNTTSGSDSILLNYGPFISSLINFLALMLVVYLGVNFALNKIMTKEELESL